MATTMLKLVVVTFVALLLTVGRSEAVKCYDCPTGCSSTAGAATCDGPFCLKSTASVGQNTIVQRICAPAGLTAPYNGCQSGSGVEVCYCSRDLCNGDSDSGSSALSLQQHAGVYALLASSAAVVLLAKLQG